MQLAAHFEPVSRAVMKPASVSTEKCWGAHRRPRFEVDKTVHESKTRGCHVKTNAPNSIERGKYSQADAAPTSREHHELDFSGSAHRRSRKPTCRHSRLTHEPEKQRARIPTAHGDLRKKFNRSKNRQNDHQLTSKHSPDLASVMVPVVALRFCKAPARACHTHGSNPRDDAKGPAKLGTYTRMRLDRRRHKQTNTNPFGSRCTRLQLERVRLGTRLRHTEGGVRGQVDSAVRIERERLSKGHNNGAKHFSTTQATTTCQSGAPNNNTSKRQPQPQPRKSKEQPSRCLEIPHEHKPGPTTPVAAGRMAAS